MATAGGPRRGLVPNQYPAKAECQCVDKEGRPAPIPDGDTGDCIGCGHHVHGLPEPGFRSLVHGAVPPARGASRKRQEA